MERNDEAIRTLVDRIRQHVGEHPGAADTADGITRWWLADVAPDLDRRLVEAALERLVAAAEFDRVVLPNGILVFRRH